jgi:diguanylate cyclase (GGDEF)-like protein/PAS domain S-box-containing protein
MMSETLAGPGGSAEHGRPPEVYRIPVVDLDTDQGFRALAEVAPAAVLVLVDGFYVFANSRALALFGARSIEELRDRPALDFVELGSRDEAAARMRSLVTERRPLPYAEQRAFRLDGTPVDVEWGGAPLEVAGAPAALIVARDLGPRKQAEKEVRTAELRWQAAFRHARTAMLITDETGWVLTANPALARLVQRDLSAIVDAPCWAIVYGKDRPNVRRDWDRLVRGEAGAIEGEFRYEREDGETGWVYANAAPLGEDHEFIIHLTDITGIRRTQQTLARRANRDPLTGLANRYVIFDRLSAHPSEPIEPVALLYLDLDGFKQINDTYGHHVGDAILVVVGERLRGAVPAEDTVGRLGGDEFAVVLRGQDCADRAEHVARRITEVLTEPVTVDGRTMRVTASIGIAAASDVGERGGQELLADADAAMYDNKIASIMNLGS